MDVISDPSKTLSDVDDGNDANDVGCAEFECLAVEGCVTIMFLLLKRLFALLLLLLLLFLLLSLLLLLFPLLLLLSVFIILTVPLFLFVIASNVVVVVFTSFRLKSKCFPTFVFALLVLVRFTVSRFSFTVTAVFSSVFITIFFILSSLFILACINPDDVVDDDDDDAVAAAAVAAAAAAAVAVGRLVGSKSITILWDLSLMMLSS